jgi:general secretion pathway protein D
MQCARLQRRTLKYMLAALCSLLVSACALPYEQLSMPGPITGSIANAPASQANTKSGSPLTTPPGRGTKVDRMFEGTGKFSAAPASTLEPFDNPKAAANAKSNASTASSASTGPDGITLNLANASIAEAAKIVLGDTMGVNYVVSDKLNANITLRTVRPVDKAGLLEIFDAALRSEGAAVVATGDVYKVVPANEAGAGGAPLRAPGARSRQQVGLATEIVPLRYVSATEMERVLRSASPQAGILRVDTARNLLMIQGTKTELAGMSELVSVFDVDWMRGMSFAILPVETNDVDAIAQELDAVFANDRESPTKGIVKFLPNRRLKSILVITSRPEYLKKAGTWLKRIDLASRASDKQVQVYHVQHRPAAELAVLLQKVYVSRDPGSPQSGAASRSIVTSPSSPDGVAAPFAAPVVRAPATPGFNGPAPDGTRSADAALNQGLPAPSADSAPTDTARSSIGGGLPPDDRSAGVSIVSDDVNNSLVITATPAEYKRLRQILQSIDVAANQVLLEATIAEVSLNDNLKFGLRWFLQKGSSSFSFTDSAIGAVAPTFPGFSYFLNLTNLQVVLNALSSVTDVNVISSPTLMVVENKRAVLQVGDEVPIATQSAVAVGAPGAPIVNSVSFRSTGVILGITPRVSDDGRVMLEIEQEVSGVIPTTSSTIDSPTIQQRRIKTTVTARDGETIVLAGLMQDKSTRTRDQVPLIGNIPWIGNAFKNKNDRIERTELLIAITPQVVRNSQQIDGITAEYRDKINLSTRPQRQAPPSHREQLDRIAR